MNKKRAFSLIEILITVAIIGILAMTIFYSLNFARVKARDASRKKDLRMIQSAMQLYINSNQTYPLKDSTGWSWVLSTHHSDQYGWNRLTSALVPKYLNAELLDPINDADNRYRYSYRTGQSLDWDLRTSVEAALDARLEYPKDNDIGAGVFSENTITLDNQTHRIYSIVVSEQTGN